MCLFYLKAIYDITVPCTGPILEIAYSILSCDAL